MGAIQHGLIQASNLQKIMIDYNYLGDEGVTAVCDAISVFTNFKHLSIANNDITPAVLMQLGPILNDSKLEVLSITASELSIDTEIFLQFIQYSESLR